MSKQTRKPRGPAGTRFGSLVYVGKTGLPGKAASRMGVFKCDCGTVKTLQYGNVASGNSLSCGCGKKTRRRRAALGEDGFFAGPKMRSCQKCGCKTHNYFKCTTCWGEIFETASDWMDSAYSVVLGPR